MNDDSLKSPEGMVERADDFLDVAEKSENAGVFGLDAPHLTQSRALTSAMQARLDRRHLLETQLASINAEIKETAPVLEADLRSDLRVASASGASDALKAEAHVTIPKARVLSHPITPTYILANPVANGTVELRWDRAANIRGCKFVVEKRVTADWGLVDIITATTLTVPAKIGERAAYRVAARNGQGTSLPSNEAVIYDG